MNSESLLDRNRRSSNEDVIDIGIQSVPYRSVSSKGSLKQWIVKSRWAILFIIVFICMIVMTIIYRREFFQGLEKLSSIVKDMGVKGYLLMSLIIFASAFPPIFGYATFQTLSGYTYGVAIGFPISYFSGLLGAMSCFVLSRYFFKEKVNRMLKVRPKFRAVVRAVEKKGFRLLVLVRIAPHPFNLMNVLFSATNISLLHFSTGTAIALIKVLLHVYIGANLTSFAKYVLGEEEEVTPEEAKVEKIKYSVAIVLGIFAFSVFAYIYTIAKKAIEEVNDVGRYEEEEEQLAFLIDQEVDDDSESDAIELEQRVDNHHQSVSMHDETRDSMSLNNWDNWDEEEESAKPKNDRLVSKYD